MTGVVIDDADLARPADAAAVVALVDGYARGPGGQNAPIGARARERMAEGLRAHPAMFVLLARADGEAVGVAVCLEGFSTFAGAPSLNVHDLAVAPEWQGRGVGRRLLEEVERRARLRGCCKLTLEVHESNATARRLYERFGFGGWDVPTYFVTKTL